VKILHLIYTHGVSGAEKYLKHLMPGLKDYGIECHLVVVCPKAVSTTLKAYCREMESLGIRSTLIVSSRLRILKTASAINKYMREQGIGILHSHLLNSDLIAAVLKSFFNPRVYLISTKHGYQEKVLEKYVPGKAIRPNDLYYYITKYTLRKIDANIAVSRVMSELFCNIGLSKVPYPYIHHGVDIKEFDKETYAAECRLANPQLIIVGRIEKFKGHFYLIDALPRIVAACKGVKLLVLGEGSQTENCMKWATERGVADHVRFLGFKAHPYSYISHSDVIVLPSLFEPFGLVYIEAFALKIPVVAFDTPAGNEIMEHNKTALLSARGDSAQLADQIIYLLQNPAERFRIAESASEVYKERFTTKVMIRKTAEWYLSLGK